MIRWLSLRLFISLLALPFIATGLLLVLHRFVMQGVYFEDVPVIVLLWFLLLIAVHFALVNVGKKRFQLLLDSGWQALKANQIRVISSIFLQIDTLLSGGLLTPNRSKSLRESLLRRYFDFYRDNVTKKNFRAGLVDCLKLNIRRNEAYHALKTYLLQQPALTVPLVDLAETLLELKPHDKNVAEFMVEKYLADEQRHFRAEYFYAHEFEQGGRFCDAICDLCLPGLQKGRRSDDFACFVYLHAVAANPGLLDQFGRRLYNAHRLATISGRDDILSQKLAAVVAKLPAGQIAAWQDEENGAAEKRISVRLARWKYFVYQKTLLLWGMVLRERQKVTIVAGSLIALLLIIFFVPFADIFKSKPVVVEQAPAPAVAGKTRFSLQVSASKKRSGAMRELNRLKKKGVDAFLIKPGRKGGWYKIYLGKFATQIEARKKGAQLRKAKIVRDYFVVNYKGKK